MSAEEFAYYLNKMDHKVKDVDEYIMSLEQDEYRTFLILVRCFQIYKLRQLPEPKFMKSGNLYQFLQKDLQICFHKQEDLRDTFLDKTIKNVIFIRSKNFKERADEDSTLKNFKITYIQHDQMIIPFLDPQILSVTVLNKFELYEGVEFDKKAPQILYDDPFVAKIGAQLGQVLRFELLMIDKLPYVEIHYRIVTKKQVKIRDVKDDDEED